MRIGVAMTGASGLPYALRLVDVLLDHGHEVDLMVTEAAVQVAAKEMDLAWSASNPVVAFPRWESTDRLKGISHRDIGGCHASGTSGPDAVVVVPCSMNALARLATGLGERAHERAVEVAFKEHRPVILVPREMPLSVIALENMTRLARAGARILPACPGFWHRPQSVEDIVDFVVQRILNQLQIEIHLVEAWQG